LTGETRAGPGAAMIDNELVVRIPHRLGAVEAQRRIAGGLDAAKAQYGRYVQVAETEWAGNRLSFRLSALAQTIQGAVAVEDEFVELRAQLPLVIRLLAKRFIPVVESAGQKLLE
jgi:hypothetical protein